MADAPDIDLYADDLGDDFQAEEGDEEPAGDALDLYDDLLTTGISSSGGKESNGKEKAAITHSTHSSQQQSGNSLHHHSSTSSSLIGAPVSSTQQSHQQQSNSKRIQLYVGNLTWWTTDSDVENAISSIGVSDLLEVRFHENRANGQSKGFCVITVSSEQSARACMDKLPKKELHGQMPIVTFTSKQALNQFEAQSKSRPSRQSSPPRSGGTSGVPSLTVGLLGPPPGGPMVVNGPPGLGGSHGSHSHGHGPGPRLMLPGGGGGSGGPPPLTSLSLPPPPQHGSQRSLQPGIPVPPPSHPGHPAPHPGVLSVTGMASLGHPHGHPHPGHPGSMHPSNMTPPRGPPPGLPIRAPPPHHHPGLDPRIPPPRGEWGLQPAPHVNPAFFPPPVAAPPPGFPPPMGPPPPFMTESRDMQQGGQQQQPPQQPTSATPAISEAEFEEVMGRNRTVSSSAIARAVNDAATGDFGSAIETLVTAISLIKQSKVAHDERCKILVSSLQDTLHGIEAKSYGSRRDRSRSRDRDRRRRRERSRSRDRDRDRDRSGRTDDYVERPRERERDYDRPRERERDYERRERERSPHERYYRDDERSYRDRGERDRDRDVSASKREVGEREMRTRDDRESRSMRH